MTSFGEAFVLAFIGGAFLWGGVSIIGVGIFIEFGITETAYWGGGWLLVAAIMLISGLADEPDTVDSNE